MLAICTIAIYILMIVSVIAKRICPIRSDAEGDGEEGESPSLDHKYDTQSMK